MLILKGRFFLVSLSSNDNFDQLRKGSLDFPIGKPGWLGSNMLEEYSFFSLQLYHWQLIEGFMSWMNCGKYKISCATIFFSRNSLIQKLSLLKARIMDSRSLRINNKTGYYICCSEWRTQCPIWVYKVLCNNTFDIIRCNCRPFTIHHTRWC